MGRDDVRGKRKAKQVIESDEEEDEAAQVVELEEDEDDEPIAKGKAAAKKTRDDGGRKSSGGGAGPSRRSTGAGASGSGAGRGGDDGAVTDCADVKLSDLIKEAKDRLEEAETALKNDVSDKDRNNLVREVIRYMLFSNPRTKDAPVLKTELNGIVTKVSKERGLADVIIRTAQLRFLENFGMEMVELAKRKAQKPAKKALKTAEAADKLEYILRSTVPAKVRAKVIDQPGAALALRGLAMVVISLISISGGQISEDDLNHHLGTLGVQKGAKDHPAFGNVANALETLCKQRFVMLEADPADDKKKVYTLAEAAQDQMGPDLINKFIGFYAQPGMGGGEEDDD